MTRHQINHPSDEELAAIREGLEQADRGELISEEELEARWKLRASRSCG